VQHLHVHLENGQRVYFSNDNVAKKVEKPPETTLTAFFSLCQTDDFAKTLLYYDSPKYFTWDNSQKNVILENKAYVTVLRSSNLTLLVESIQYIQVIKSVLFLRILLHNVIGPISFGYLRTVNGITYKSYREACQQLGLLKDDKYWDDALAEANETKKSSSFKIIIFNYLDFM